MQDLGSLFFFAAIAAVFWLLFIRPNVRRQKAQVAMQKALQVGDEVMLTSGFYGILRGLDDARVEIELAPGTTVTVARGAVGSVVPAEQDDTDHAVEADDTADAPRTSDAEEN